MATRVLCISVGRTLPFFFSSFFRSYVDACAVVWCVLCDAVTSDVCYQYRGRFIPVSFPAPDAVRVTSRESDIYRFVLVCAEGGYVCVDVWIRINITENTYGDVTVDNVDNDGFAREPRGERTEPNLISSRICRRWVLLKVVSCFDYSRLSFRSGRSHGVFRKKTRMTCF